MESYGNLGGAKFAAAGDGFSYKGAQDDSLAYAECCKNQMMADERMAIPGFPAQGPDGTYCPPGGISCT